LFIGVEKIQVFRVPAGETGCAIANDNLNSVGVMTHYLSSCLEQQTGEAAVRTIFSDNELTSGTVLNEL
jgi:hypothetical protein